MHPDDLVRRTANLVDEVTAMAKNVSPIGTSVGTDISQRRARSGTTSDMAKPAACVERYAARWYLPVASITIRVATARDSIAGSQRHLRWLHEARFDQASMLIGFSM